MKKIRCLVYELNRTAGFVVLGFAGWMLVRHWRAGRAEKTGHALDSSIKLAAAKLEKTAVVLEKWAESGLGENLGKGVDEVLTDTKNTLEKATGLFQRTLNRTK